MEKQMIDYFSETINYKNKDQMYNVNKKIKKGDKTDLVTQLLYLLYDKSTTNEGQIYQDYINNINNKNLDLQGQNVNLQVEIDCLKRDIYDYQNKIEVLKEKLYKYDNENEPTFKKRFKQEREKNEQLSNELYDFKRRFKQYETEMISLKQRERPETEKDKEIQQLKQKIQQQQRFYSEQLEIEQEELIKRFESQNQK